MRLKTTYLMSILFAIILLLPTLTHAENMSNEEIKAKLPQLLGQSNAGKEFWFTIPPVYEATGDPGNFIKIFITSPVRTLVTLEVPSTGYYRSKNTVPNDVIGFDVAPAVGQPFLFDPRVTKPKAEKIYSGRGIHIYAKDPLVVYVVCRYRYTSDGFLAIPVSAFGKEYIVASYPDMGAMYSGYRLPSITGIVAAYDNTKVRFTLGGTFFTETAGGMKAGDSKSWRLDKGDVLMFMGDGDEHDLTGSKVVASKPVGVVSGNNCTNIPTNNKWCDYTVEMDLPMMSWGRIIPVGKVPNRTNSGIVRIFSKERNNNIYRDGRQISTIPDVGGVLGRGFQEMRIYPNDKGSNSALFSADKPFSITFYNPGTEEDINSSNSDPFVMAMTPVEQFQKEITFCTPAIAGGLSFPENYLNLVYQVDENGFVPKDMMFAQVRQGKFQWTPIRSAFPGLDFMFTKLKDGRQYALKTILLPSDGVYRIKADRPFACYSFGYSSYDSYGYPTSAALADLSKPDTVAPDPLWEEACDGTVKGAVVTDRPNDAEIRSNLADIFYQSALSFNYNFEYEDIIAGETISTTWKLNVKDKTNDARAVISFMDRAGNDSTIVINYYATKVTVYEDWDYGNLELGKIYTHTFTIENLSEKSSVTIPDPIDNFLKLKKGNQGFTIKHDFPSPLTLKPLEKRTFTIEFTSDSSGSYLDSVGIGDDCVFAYRFEIKANVGMPLIEVSDFSFGKIKVGTTSAPTEITIRNPGSSDLIITKYSTPLPVYAHTIRDLPLPITIKAGDSKQIQFQVTFTPDEAIKYPSAIYFTSNATGTDSVCVLNGEGIRPGLQGIGVIWDTVRINRPGTDFVEQPYDGNLRVWNDSSMAITIYNVEIKTLAGDSTAFTFDESLFDGKVIEPGKSFEVPVSFLPTEIGYHSIKLKFNNSEGWDRSAILEGWGKLGRITMTETLDFGSMVVGNTTDIRTKTITIKNVDYGPFSDNVTIWDLNVGQGINTDLSKYGTEGFNFDKTINQTNPAVLMPGDSITFDVNFVAQKTGASTGTISIPVSQTGSDAENVVESNWTGDGTRESWSTGEADTLICLGESAILTIPITNDSKTDIYVESVAISPANPDITYNASGFPLAPNESRDLSFNFTPSSVYSSTHEVIFNVRKADSTFDDSIRGSLTVASQFFERSTSSRATPPTVDPKSTPIEYAVSLNPGEDITDAGIREIAFTVTYKKDFLAYNTLNNNPNALKVGAAYATDFEFVQPLPAPTIIDPVNNIEEIKFSLVPIDGITPVNDPGEMFTMEFRAYFPSYTEGQDKGLTKDKKVDINCVVEFVGPGSGCASVSSPDPSPTVSLNAVCADDLRHIFISSTDYVLGEVNPNPVGSGGATIEFGVGLSGYTQIKIYNSNSEVVDIPVSSDLKSGNYSFRIPVDKLSSGVYFYEMKSGPFVQTRKLVIAK